MTDERGYKMVEIEDLPTNVLKQLPDDVTEVSSRLCIECEERVFDVPTDDGIVRHLDRSGDDRGQIWGLGDAEALKDGPYKPNAANDEYVCGWCENDLKDKPNFIFGIDPEGNQITFSHGSEVMEQAFYHEYDDRMDPDDHPATSAIEDYLTESEMSVKEGMYASVNGDRLIHNGEMVEAWPDSSEFNYYTHDDYEIRDIFIGHLKDGGIQLPTIQMISGSTLYVPKSDKEWVADWYTTFAKEYTERERGNL